jgi:hypothetical protein
VKPILSALTVLATFLAPSALADTITGRVVDAAGNGVQGVDIDVENLAGGGDPTIFNDGTDADGFFVTTVPAGFYRVIFTPPAPPTTTHLIAQVDDVVVVGTTAMGTIALPAGVSLGAHVKTTGGAPVAGVDVDVIDESTGDSLDLSNDFTDAFGNFLVAVPAGPIELRLDATSVIGSVLVSQAQDLTLAGNTVLPDVVLVQGHTVTGTVQTTGSSAVEDADVDVTGSTTGERVYTPGDRTLANGTFSVVVPPGTWDVEVCPNMEDLLVAAERENVAVAGNVGLGIIQVEDGVVLTGTVSDSLGNPVAGADLEVSVSATGASILTCNDDTDASGSYSVVVPPGTLDVWFLPPDFFSGLGADVHTGVLVGSGTVLAGVLPDCVEPTTYGTGLAGSGGLVPRISTTGGVASESNPGWGITLDDGLGGALAILALSSQPASVPWRGGTILVNISPGVSFSFLMTLDGPVGAVGAGSTVYMPPSLAGAGGFTGYAQFAVRDAGAQGRQGVAPFVRAPKRWALSQGLRIDFCR